MQQAMSWTSASTYKVMEPHWSLAFTSQEKANKDSKFVSRRGQNFKRCGFLLLALGVNKTGCIGQELRWIRTRYGQMESLNLTTELIRYLTSH